MSNNCSIAVDRSGYNKDFTAILFYKVNKNKIEVLETKTIPLIEDIAKYIEKLKDEMIKKTGIYKNIVR